MAKAPPAPKQHDRRAPDPWRDDVDSHLRFLRKEAKQGSRDRQLFRTELDAHTEILGKTLVTVRSMDTTVKEMAPFITGIQKAKAVGRFSSYWSGIISKFMRAGIVVIAIVTFVLAITHGETWAAAGRAFWHVVTGTVE